MAEDYFGTMQALNGLVVGVPNTYIPLGTSSGTDSRSVTPNEGKTIVGETVETPTNFWDFLGNAAKTLNTNPLINRYVDGKITKELTNDGVPLYTTYGNPNDQAGGKLLQDVAVEQQNATRTYWLIGGGVVAVLVGLYFVTRK